MMNVRRWGARAKAPAQMSCYLLTASCSGFASLGSCVPMLCLMPPRGAEAPVSCACLRA